MPQGAVNGMLYGSIKPVQIHMSTGLARTCGQPGGRGCQAATCQHDVGFEVPCHSYGLPGGCEQKAGQRPQGDFHHRNSSGTLFCTTSRADQQHLCMVRKFIGNVPVQAFHTANQWWQVAGDVEDACGRGGVQGFCMVWAGSLIIITLTSWHRLLAAVIDDGYRLDGVLDPVVEQSHLAALAGQQLVSQAQLHVAGPLGGQLFPVRQSLLKTPPLPSGSNRRRCSRRGRTGSTG